MDNLGDYFMSRSKSGRRLEVKFGYWNEKGATSEANVEEDAWWCAESAKRRSRL